MDTKICVTNSKTSKVECVEIVKSAEYKCGSFSLQVACSNEYTFDFAALAALLQRLTNGRGAQVK